MTKVRADTLKIGDTILPPDREIRLWMRRELEARKLPESAFNLTIIEIREGNADKKSRWLVIRCDQTPEWNADRVKPTPFTFKVRPETLWPKIEP